MHFFSFFILVILTFFSHIRISVYDSLEVTVFDMLYHTMQCFLYINCTVEYPKQYREMMIVIWVVQ